MEARRRRRGGGGAEGGERLRRGEDLLQREEARDDDGDGAGDGHAHGDDADVELEAAAQLAREVLVELLPRRRVARWSAAAHLKATVALRRVSTFTSAVVQVPW